MPQPEPFRRSVDSGLFLPTPLSRERQVWTRDEWKLLERCTKLLNSHGIQLQMQCARKTCQTKPLEASRLPSGEFQLRCAHADRVMTKAF